MRLLRLGFCVWQGGKVVLGLFPALSAVMEGVCGAELVSVEYN